MTSLTRLGRRIVWLHRPALLVIAPALLIAGPRPGRQLLMTRRETGH